MDSRQLTFWLWRMMLFTCLPGDKSLLAAAGAFTKSKSNQKPMRFRRPLSSGPQADPNHHLRPNRRRPSPFWFHTGIGVIFRHGRSRKASLLRPWTYWYQRSARQDCGPRLLPRVRVQYLIDRSITIRLPLLNQGLSWFRHLCWLGARRPEPRPDQYRSQCRSWRHMPGVWPDLVGPVRWLLRPPPRQRSR